MEKEYTQVNLTNSKMVIDIDYNYNENLTHSQTYNEHNIHAVWR